MSKTSDQLITIMNIRRESMMLCHKLAPNDKVLNPENWLVSEKLDGFRCIWDGGVSRGEACKNVPYANSAKPERLCSGLFTRNWLPISAPTWFLDQLPIGHMLDGELWAGRGKYQVVSSTCRKLVPVDSEWKRIRYKVYDSPTPSVLLGDGRVVISGGKSL